MHSSRAGSGLAATFRFSEILIDTSGKSGVWCYHCLSSNAATATDLMVRLTVRQVLERKSASQAFFAAYRGSKECSPFESIFLQPSGSRS